MVMSLGVQPLLSCRELLRGLLSDLGMRLSQQILSSAGAIHRTVNQIYNADHALLCAFYLYSPQTGFGTSNRQVWPPLLAASLVCLVGPTLLGTV